MRELELLNAYWEHGVFRVARILGLVLALAAFAATITALALDRWALITIAPVG